MKLFIWIVCTCLAFGAGAQTSDTIDDAWALYRCGKLQEAEELAVRSMNESVALSDTTAYIKAICLQAEIAIDSGNDSEAAVFYNRCFELSGFGEPMFTLSSSLYNIALIYYQNKEYEKAMEYAVKSVSIDSNRASDSVLGLRYLLVARILYEKGEYSRALEYIEKGKSLTSSRRNHNVSGRFTLLETLCNEGLSGDNPDWAALERGYQEAYDLISTKLDGFHHGKVNPYLPEVCYHLGLVSDARGKDGKPYLREAAQIAGMPQTMRGINPMTVLQANSTLADILEKEGDPEGAARYRAKADSLSFVPYISEMCTKLSLNQIEFIRREKDMEIQRQKTKTMTMVFVTISLAVFVFLLLLMYRNLCRQKMTIEEKNAQLVKLNLQKDKLIEIMKENPDLSGTDSQMKAIANDKVPLPEITLSKREKEIIEQCSKGFISKEIAARLGISVRTVEAHKNNIFRKIGVSTTSELVAYAFKTGIIK